MIDYSKNEFMDVHIDDSLNNYSRYIQNNELTHLKTKISKVYNINYDVTLTHGSEDSLYKLLLFLRVQLTRLLVTDISWDYYKVLGKKLNYSIDSIPSYKTSVLEPNIECLLETATDKHVVIIGNPCNPSSRIIGEDSIKKLLHKNITIIIDCTYQSPCEFKDTVEKYYDYPNAILITSFSKFFGIPGARMGFFVTKDQQYHTSLNLYLGFNTDMVNVVNIALDNVDYYNTIRSHIKQNIHAICKHQYSNFELHEGVMFIIVIFKNMICESIVSDICKLHNCKIKYLKKDNVILRVSVSNNKKDLERIYNLLDSLENSMS